MQRICWKQQTIKLIPKSKIYELNLSSPGIHYLADALIRNSNSIYFFLGKAEPALIKSDQKGSEYDRFNLEWTARSLTTVEKFKVEYKTVSAKEWKSIEVEAFTLPVEENTYTGTGMISHLKPATVYLARVSSRNAYGFSKPSQAFKFATRGAGKNYYIWL